MINYYKDWKIYFKVLIQVLDTQAIRNKITFTTTLGLVVHSAGNFRIYSVKK
jgi:hypothetical protein